MIRTRSFATKDAHGEIRVDIYDDTLFEKVFGKMFDKNLSQNYGNNSKYSGRFNVQNNVRSISFVEKFQSIDFRYLLNRLQYMRMNSSKKSLLP